MKNDATIDDTRPLSLGPAIRAGIDGVRARARASLAVRGAASALLIIVALSLLSFGLDRMLRLAWGSRATILVIMLSMIGVVVWTRLLRPLLVELPDVELARLVEARHPALEWRLLSAVQFGDPAWRAGRDASRELAALVIADAEARAASVDFGGVVPLPPALQAAGRALVVVAAGAMLVSAFPEQARTWFRRDVLLSTTDRWPQDTTLVVRGFEETDTLVVPHGSDLTLSVEAQGVFPPRVYLETEGDPDAEAAPDAPPPREERLVLDGLGEGRYRATLDDVSSSFRFTVSGGDAEVGPLRVRVIRRPWVEALTFTVTPPPHTRLPERSFGMEAGSASLPLGTRVRIEATVTKPLRSIRFEERGAASGTEGGEDVAVLHSAVTTPTGFACELTLERTASFEVDVVDQDDLGFAQPVRFGLVAQPDEAPEVQLAPIGVGLNVTPQATVRVRVSVTDDYGIASGRLRLKVAGGTKPEQNVEQDQPLAALASAKEAEASATLELSALQLAPRMSVTLWAEAQDADPRGPNAGASPVCQLRIVTPEQLLGELLRRLHEQRLELERMILEEERLAQGLAGQDKATLERAPRAHRDVGRAVLRAAEVVDGVVAEMTSNKLLDAATWDRLTEDVARPLRALQQGPLQQARDLAERAASADEAARPDASLHAGTSAAVVAQELKRIVSRMGRIEELAELVASLKKIIDRQEELMDRMRTQPPPGGRRPR